MRLAVLTAALILILAACADGETASTLAPGGGDGPVPTLAAPRSEGPASNSAVVSNLEDEWLSTCDVIPAASAPDDWYKESPVYVGNEMPVEEVRAWAQDQPGFEEVWIDRDRNGWIAVAFSGGVADRQADLEREFPGVGVVAVQVDWHLPDLYLLQERVVDEVRQFLDSFGAGVSITQGVLSVDVPILSDEIKAEFDARFPGEPICLNGLNPAFAPVQGPQPDGGDGWRLLADQPGVGEVYRTGIATDAASYSTLWDVVGLEGNLPEVDFVSEVVVWFGAVVSGSCPDVRLDNVIIDADAGLLYADINLVTLQTACTADANPHAYVVAVERDSLPAGPFSIQLDADGPPGGAPEERTVVGVDLSESGTVAGPGDVGSDPNLPEPWSVKSGDIIETGYPAPYLFYAHCGIEWLGEFNSYVWRTDSATPSEWEVLMDETQTIELEILMHKGPDPKIDATAAGVTVAYVPSSEPIPGCD